MGLICPNCGNTNESDSKFCAQCGYSLPLSAKQAARVNYGPIAPSEPTTQSSKVVFVGPSHRSSPRRQSTGSFAALLFFCFFIAIFILLPLLFFAFIVPMGPMHGFGNMMDDFGTTMGDFGTTMGEFGSAIGGFFGELGSRLGDFFGGIGSGIGEFFGAIFSDFDHLTIVGVLFRVFFGFFMLFVIISIVAAIFRSARGHCSSR